MGFQTVSARGYVTELYYGIILRNHITAEYYGIISQNHLYEKDPGDARDVPGAPWDPGYPLGTPLGPLGTPLAPARDAPGTPRGRPWDPHGPAGTPYGPQNGNISNNIQSHKLLIFLFKFACWGPSPQRLPGTVLYIKRQPKSKNDHPALGFR